MRQYYSNNKNYKAILESMAQIRENQLNEMHDGRRNLMAAHGGMHDDDSYDGAAGGMRAAYGGRIPEDDPEMLMMSMHGDEEEMEEGMYEGEHEDDEDAQMEALAEMMDEALMELDNEDDDDNQMLDEDEDDERRARRRARLRNALLIGAGLVASGGVAGAAMMNPTARTMIGQGAGQAISGAGEFAKGVAQAGYGMLPQTTRDQISGGIEAGKEYVDSTAMPAVQSMASDVDTGIMNTLQKDNFKVPGLGPDATEAARRAAGRQYMRATGKLANPTAQDASKMRKLNYLNRGGRNPAFSVGPQ